MSEALDTSAPAPAPAAVPMEQVPGRNLQEKVEYLDKRDTVQAQIALADWADSNEMATNLRLVKQGVAMLPEEKRAMYETGRLRDGRAVLNDPATVRAMAEAMRQPSPELVKAAEKHGGDELAAIDELRRADRKAYFANDSMRARERDLIRDSETVREHLDTEYAKSADGLKRDLDYLRQGFAADPKNFERNEISKLIQQGMPPTRAHAVAAYYKARLKGSR